MSCYGIPLVATIAAATEEEAAAAAAQLGGRVVLKAEAEGLVHRTDAGGVRVDLRTPQEVAEGYRTLAADFGPRLQRVLVQPMLAGGVEVHIGVVQEPVFGPLVVFGSGDAATEVPGDQVARLTPLTDADAERDDPRGARRAAAGRPTGARRRRTPPRSRTRCCGSPGSPMISLRSASWISIPSSPGRTAFWCVDVRVRISPAEPRDPFLRRLL